MTRCLHDPLDGYYATRPALGARGDFITAPLVSQMFGELIGLWLVETWRGLGAPARFVLAEAGPGDGTLMSDLLRAARLDRRFLAAADLWLVETSAPLRGAAGRAPRRGAAAMDGIARRVAGRRAAAAGRQRAARLPARPPVPAHRIGLGRAGGRAGRRRRPGVRPAARAASPGRSAGGNGDRTFAGAGRVRVGTRGPAGAAARVRRC